MIANPRRLFLASSVVIPLAILCVLQAISSVASKRAPELAIMLMPTNGLAREQVAFSEFTSRVTDPEDTQPAAEFASEAARKTLRSGPLAPKAYAIIAMAQRDKARRRHILELATKLDRRELSLQSLWLNEMLMEGDFTGTIESLDRILRVHSRFQDQFFPVLGEALEEEETIPLFAEFLDGQTPWQNRFLDFAVKKPVLQPNLALLRAQIDVDNEGFDRRLIAGLVREGAIPEAYVLYSHLSAEGATNSDADTGPWKSARPPFDWYFADETGFRAQQSLNAQAVEITVRPGKGGVLVERFVRAPDGPFRIRIKHHIAPIEQLRDVRLQANCAGSGTPYFDEGFVQGEVVFKLPTAPDECEFISLVINARAWSGRSSLSGTIDSFETMRAGEALPD